MKVENIIRFLFRILQIKIFKFFFRILEMPIVWYYNKSFKKRQKIDGKTAEEVQRFGNEDINYV